MASLDFGFVMTGIPTLIGAENGFSMAIPTATRKMFGVDIRHR
jgi:hypothetical protein